MKINKRTTVYFSIIIMSFLLFFFSFNFFNKGNIKIKVYNNTNSEQVIWLVPKDEYTSVLKPGEKVSIKYSTDQFETSLVLNYMDSTGKVEPIVLSEYVKKHEQGTVVLKMVQSDDNEVKFQITDNIK